MYLNSLMNHLKDNVVKYWYLMLIWSNYSTLAETLLLWFSIFDKNNNLNENIKCSLVHIRSNKIGSHSSENGLNS